MTSVRCTSKNKNKNLTTQGLNVAIHSRTVLFPSCKMSRNNENDSGSRVFLVHRQAVFPVMSHSSVGKRRCDPSSGWIDAGASSRTRSLLFTTVSYHVRHESFY